ncbi:TPA: Fic family protein [Providencia stuartii]|nr:Fic family protein [Providencia stuartii]
MLRMKRPPVLDVSKVWSEIIEKHSEHIQEYFKLSHITDDSGKYVHYDKLRYKLLSQKHIDSELAWGVIKIVRTSQKINAFPMGDNSELSSFVLTPNIQKVLSETDRNATTAALEWMTSNIGEEHYLKFLLNDLIEDESISSSQLEGAATTTLAAKNIIKKKKKARTMDEKMILGNFKMMQYAWDNKDKPLSVAMIKKLHHIGVDGINDEKYSPGVFRDADDNVVVVDSDDNIVHTPPSAENLEKHFSILTKWVNTCHDDASGRDYIHPLIKAIIIHFFIGYEHPFKDGNGRVARSLFYWFMFKNNYAAFRYIAISTTLKQRAKKYGMSYVHSEMDQLDLTYFIEDQCKVVLSSINKFKKTYTEAKKSMEEFDRWMWESGLYKKLNDNQKAIFSVAKAKLENTFTANSVSEKLECSYNTASAALNGLHKIGIFRKRKDGREYIYSMKSLKSIREAKY